MKHLLRTLLVLAPVVLGAQTVATTKHNLSISGPNTVFKTGTLGNQVCVYCHTPHNALNTNGPLWNRAASAATYTMYGTTLRGTTTAATPGANSKSCLSCHDGTVAMFSLNNTYLGTITAADMTSPKPATSNVSITTGMITGATLVGPVLTNDHPVSIAYPPAATAGYKDVATFTTMKLFSNQVECASCHLVHDSTNSPFLRRSNAGSALCNECHTK